MSQPDEILVARYQKGDAAAFRELYARYRTGTLNYLLFLVRDRAVAEDLQQDAWISITKAALDWKPEGSLRSWIFTVMKNRFLDHVRKVKRSPPGDENGDVIDLPGPDVDPEDPILRDAVRACVDTLNPEQKQVVVLRMTGLTFAEITEVMGSPDGLANRRMQLATEKLKRCLENKGIRGEP